MLQNISSSSEQLSSLKYSVTLVRSFHVHPCMLRKNQNIVIVRNFPTHVFRCFCIPLYIFSTSVGQFFVISVSDDEDSPGLFLIIAALL